MSCARKANGFEGARAEAAKVARMSSPGQPDGSEPELSSPDQQNETSREPTLWSPDRPAPPVQMCPPGSTCAIHQEREGLLECSHCGNAACVECWQTTHHACIACVLAQPEVVAPSVPWETEGVGWWRGFVDTIRLAASPNLSAPGLSGRDVRPALAFALLTFVPLVAAEGIIPYTHTLLFESPLQVAPVGSPHGSTIALDVLRAASLGVLLGVVQLVTLGLCFTSLTTAFGVNGKASAANGWRAVLYRAFIVAGFPTVVVAERASSDGVFALLGWIGGGAIAGMTAVVLEIALGVWLLVSLRAAARLAQGVGAFMSLLIPFLAVMLSVFARDLAEQALTPLMPDSEAIAATVAASREDAPTSEGSEESEDPPPDDPNIDGGGPADARDSEAGQTTPRDTEVDPTGAEPDLSETGADPPA